ncbi:membrane protein [Neobacillus notoginsengisoli]|uniref:Membrane protein n=1 Tax=Neobacillus notoginsengisoli TaxID=1578198 RepID=A0A417YW63_9BACI|nr:membrane protein [Neobacillus notoginsengisoli]RHW41564.1 membrane protein [Neobacillus notoginsengisoli]
MALFYRFLFFFIGLMILTFGVCMTIVADFGAGAWDALNVGLSETIGLSIGRWVMIVGAILIVVNSFLHQSKPELLAIGIIFATGMLIDLWMFLILGGYEPAGLTDKLTMFIAGIVVIGIGAAIYLQAKFPLIPIDNLMMGLKKRLNVSLMVAKTIGELIALVLALIFSGPIGIGTLIITFAIGPVIQIFFPLFEKLLNRLLASANAKNEHIG